MPPAEVHIILLEKQQNAKSGPPPELGKFRARGCVITGATYLADLYWDSSLAPLSLIINSTISSCAPSKRR